MNKKITSLFFLLILLVAITLTYAYLSQPAQENNSPTDSGSTVNDDTLKNEIDANFLDENQGIEIGDMI